MVLSGENQAFKVGILDNTHQRIGIEIGGVEPLGRLIAIAPLLIRKGVNREVDKGVLLHLVPLDLVGCRNNTHRLWWFGIARHEDNRCKQNEALQNISHRLWVTFIGVKLRN